MANEQSDRLLTVAEVAERLRVHPITVRRHIKDGRLRAVRVGRAVRVRESDLEAFLSSTKVSDVRAEYGAAAATDEAARRQKVVDELLALRDGLPPPGVTSEELIKESRLQLEERHERWTRPRR
jgi:excisionase family DNA binding protein